MSTRSLTDDFDFLRRQEMDQQLFDVLEGISFDDFDMVYQGYPRQTSAGSTSNSREEALVRTSSEGLGGTSPVEDASSLEGTSPIVSNPVGSKRTATSSTLNATNLGNSSLNTSNINSSMNNSSITLGVNPRGSVVSDRRSSDLRSSDDSTTPVGHILRTVMDPAYDSNSKNSYDTDLRFGSMSGSASDTVGSSTAELKNGTSAQMNGTNLLTNSNSLFDSCPLQPTGTTPSIHAEIGNTASTLSTASFNSCTSNVGLDSVVIANTIGSSHADTNGVGEIRNYPITHSIGKKQISINYALNPHGSLLNDLLNNQSHADRLDVALSHADRLDAALSHDDRLDAALSDGDRLDAALISVERKTANEKDKFGNSAVATGGCNDNQDWRAIVTGVVETTDDTSDSSDETPPPPEVDFAMEVEEMLEGCHLVENASEPSNQASNSEDGQEVSSCGIQGASSSVGNNVDQNNRRGVIQPGADALGQGGNSFSRAGSQNPIETLNLNDLNSLSLKDALASNNLILLDKTDLNTFLWSQPLMWVDAFGNVVSSVVDGNGLPLSLGQLNVGGGSGLGSEPPMTLLGNNSFGNPALGGNGFPNVGLPEGALSGNSGLSSGNVMIVNNTSIGGDLLAPLEGSGTGANERVGGYNPSYSTNYSASYSNSGKAYGSKGYDRKSGKGYDSKGYATKDAYHGYGYNSSGTKGVTYPCDEGYLADGYSNSHYGYTASSSYSYDKSYDKIQPGRQRTHSNATDVSKYSGKYSKGVAKGEGRQKGDFLLCGDHKGDSKQRALQTGKSKGSRDYQYDFRVGKFNNTSDLRSGFGKSNFGARSDSNVVSGGANQHVTVWQNAAGKMQLAKCSYNTNCEDATEKGMKGKNYNAKDRKDAKEYEGGKDYTSGKVHEKDSDGKDHRYSGKDHGKRSGGKDDRRSSVTRRNKSERGSGTSTKRRLNNTTYSVAKSIRIKASELKETHISLVNMIQEKIYSKANTFCDTKEVAEIKKKLKDVDNLDDVVTFGVDFVRIEGYKCAEPDRVVPLIKKTTNIVLDNSNHTATGRGKPESPSGGIGSGSSSSSSSLIDKATSGRPEGSTNCGSFMDPLSSPGVDSNAMVSAVNSQSMSDEEVAKAKSKEQGLENGTRSSDSLINDQGHKDADVNEDPTGDVNADVNDANKGDVNDADEVDHDVKSLMLLSNTMITWPFEVSGRYNPGVSLLIKNVPNRFSAFMLLNMLFSNYAVMAHPVFRKIIQSNSLIAHWRIHDWPTVSKKTVFANEASSIDGVKEGDPSRLSLKEYLSLREKHEECKKNFTWEFNPLDLQDIITQEPQTTSGIESNATVTCEIKISEQIEKGVEGEKTTGSSGKVTGEKTTAEKATDKVAESGKTSIKLKDLEDMSEQELDEVDYVERLQKSKILEGPWSIRQSHLLARTLNRALHPSVAQFVDFLHLPQNLKGINLGYAFLHMRDKQVAHELMHVLSGIRFPGNTRKSLEVIPTKARLTPHHEGYDRQVSSVESRTMYWTDEENFTMFCP